MKIELLVLIPESESFCTSKKSLIEFLKVDSLIEINGQKILYKKSSGAKAISSAKFRIETDLIKSKQERYFTILLEMTDDSSMDNFNELCDRVRSTAERISPGKTTINTLWDDIGRAYAEKSYPLINEIENLMRRLIAKFMLVTVGVNWSKDTIQPELFKKIDKFGDDDPHVNDLFKLDFIHLKDVLFGKKRDISTEELDRLLLKTEFSPDDQDTIKKYVPRSNWEKYFSSVIDEKSGSIETKWALLYELRNKVAHNRHVKRSDFEKIKGLCEKLKEIIKKASAKLGEIDINEEDRDLIIHAYNSDSLASMWILSEMAAADFYAKQGYSINTALTPTDSALDFIADRNEERIGVQVKSVSLQNFSSFARITLQKQIPRLLASLERNNLSSLHMIIIARGEDRYLREERISKILTNLSGELDHRIEFKIGRLSEDNSLTSLEDIILAHNL